MLPNQSKYPQFVPDQLLTSEHLNDLFNYLEEQGRLTRTNLIGIGIVCGLEVSSDGNSVTISKGVGVTSEGYLVTVPEQKYTHYKAFNAVQERIYNRFVDGSGNQMFDLDELKQAAVEEGTTEINAAYLQNKVVLIFVELLEEGAKNCNPNSCDDKGVMVNVNFRPLLIDAADAAKLNANVTGVNAGVQQYLLLPEIKMRRFDVLATNMLETADIFEAYQKILDKSFLQNAAQTFTQAYITLSPLVIDEYASNPFELLVEKFAFINDGSITDDQLVNMQYYYDLFSDLLLAYEELRRKGLEMISLCCPDSELFPRHLLLGYAVNDGQSLALALRQYFIPSPIFRYHSHLINELRWLFKKLVLLLEKFFVPPVIMNNTTKRLGDGNIRITPSQFGNIPLSEKAIPFYYKVNDAGKLYQHWSVEKSRFNNAHRNLSYHAKDYNTADEFVLKPLLYDLEPYNFFRIEGHIGKPYTHVLKNILATRNSNRLPFEVIALSADIKNIRQQLAMILSGNFADLNQLRSTVEPGQCHFQDLESLYDTLAAELICKLCKELQYYYGFPGSNRNTPPPNSLVPQVSLLVRCAPNFRFVANTLGHEFEVFYNSIKNQPYVSADVWLQNFQTPGITNNNQGTGNVGFAIMYYIVKLSEVVAGNLMSFDLAEFVRRYDDLVKVAEFIKKFLLDIKLGDNTSTVVVFEDIFDHLDAIIYGCNKAAFEALVKEFRLRWMYVLVLQRFGYFIKLHPGIDHKAGVPRGGTFIVVYHEEEQEVIRPNFTTAFASNTNIAGTDANVRTTANNEKRADSQTVAGNANTGATSKLFETQEAFTQANSNNVNTINQQNIRIKGFDTVRQQQALQQLFANRVTSNVSLDEVIGDIPDGTVIADFYLPYICCSDCPPMQFIINEKPAEEQPNIELDTKEYCSDDKTAYQIGVSPGGGTISGEGVKSTANGFTFNPASVNLAGAQNKKVVLTYTVGSQDANVEVIVHQKPAADFSFTSGTLPNLIVFASTSKFATTFAWDFGDGQASSEEKANHNYQKPGTYKVSLKVTNGICADTTSKDVIIREQEQLSITIDPVAFCRDDRKSFAINVSPAGGEVKGEGVSTANGKSVFTPAVVNVDGNKKEISLTYVKDGESTQTAVTVFQKPVAAFQFSPSTASPLAIQFFNASQFAESFSWDFGDGKKSEEEKPNHTYKEPGEYNVTLAVRNGVCTASSSQVVSIKEQQTKTCMPANSLVDSFSKLQSVDPGNFAAFAKNFADYKDIEGFFKTFSTLIGETTEKQLDFFDSLRFGVATNAQLTLPQAMQKWLDTLMNQFIREQFDLRLLALTLYRIITNLALYIECIQKEDIGKARIDMQGVFTIIRRHLPAFEQILPNSSDAQKAEVKQLLKDFETELKRVKKNKEETTKPAYVKFLEEVISKFSTFNF